MAVGVCEIAEMARTGGTGADAGGDAIFLGQVLIIDPVDAERAFLHHAFGLVHLARPIRAGPGAKAAADAVRLIHQNNSVLDPLVAGTGGADGDAWCILAMQAGFGKMKELSRAVRRLHLIAVDTVEKGAGWVFPIGTLIAERRAVILGVPALAGYHAGMAADAGVQINHKTQLSPGGSGELSHAIWSDSLQSR